MAWIQHSGSAQPRTRDSVVRIPPDARNLGRQSGSSEQKMQQAEIPITAPYKYSELKGSSGGVQTLFEMSVKINKSFPKEKLRKQYAHSRAQGFVSTFTAVGSIGFSRNRLLGYKARNRLPNLK